MADANMLKAVDFGLDTASGKGDAFNLREVRDRAEKDAVIRVLARANGNMTRAAELLGVSRPTLYDLINRFGLR
jgi:two-component system NtrC family response regulator